MNISPLSLYQQARQQGFVADAAQEQAVLQLQRCFDELLAAAQIQSTPPAAAPTTESEEITTAPAIIGVYLWGPVGRGKTWLMDNFHQALQAQQIRSRRQHFHHFMAWLHKRLFQLTGTPNPLQHLAQELASEVQVLCFDEFFISDIGDAMLLGPLLQALFAQGLVLVTTSNEAPERLYADGFNRDRIEGALEDLARHVATVHLDGGQDHRLHGQANQQRYWLIDNDEPDRFAKLFLQLTEQPARAGQLQLAGARQLQVLGQSQDYLWCDYAALCQENLGAQDYMQLCQQFQAILLSDVPNLSAPQQQARIARGTEDAAKRVAAGDRNLAPISRHDDGVRRFIALVDECYDQQIPLYIEAALPIDELYLEGTLLFPFQRTRSRLHEMQRKKF